MYLPVKSQETCATAWLEATKLVNLEKKHEAYNVIIDIKNPANQSKDDSKIIALVDTFLKEKNQPPSETVANTIFPKAIYERHGSSEFIKKFRTLFPKIQKNARWSGYYFERMTAPIDKREGTSPLEDIIRRIKDKKNKTRNKFELSLFDPNRDIDNSPYGGQCLSFLSFKIIKMNGEKLTLTAMYRNHYYITKLLGNLIGLGRLMEFISIESGIGIGSLTVISTHAEINRPKNSTVRNISQLLSDCSSS